MTIAEQVVKHFNTHLENLIYEFYEHLEGYEESTVKDVSDGIVEGIKKWATELDSDDVYEQLIEANEDAAILHYEGDDY